jgi:hypothetical protein
VNGCGVSIDTLRKKIPKVLIAARNKEKNRGLKI